jgi:phosphatidylglycerophosphatase A
VTAAALLATWFGCGLSPKAPGTVGSLGALLPALGLLYATGAPPVTLLAPALVLTWPAIWSADAVAIERGLKDPQIVVVDEVLGQWIALAGATTLNWKSVLAAFILFRLFDITKPQPVRWLESLRGGTGIVADDLMAGVYAALVLFAAGCFNLY